MKIESLTFAGNLSMKQNEISYFFGNGYSSANLVFRPSSKIKTSFSLTKKKKKKKEIELKKCSWLVADTYTLLVEIRYIVRTFDIIRVVFCD